MDIQKYIEQKTGIPTTEVAFEQPQKLPFIVILDRTEEEGDDYHAQVILHDLAVEFYAKRIDKENEKKLEDAFQEKGWKIKKERAWIAEEKMFETIYTTNFVEKR